MSSGPDRRAFLHWLAASPLFAYLPACEDAPSDGNGATQDADGVRAALDALVTSAEDALDVFDMEAVASQNIPPAHWGYLQTGVDGERTLRANRTAFEGIYLRPRRLVDVAHIDASTELFGVEWPTPIVVAPAGSQRGFHAEGELATAHAARSQGHLQVLSSVSSTAVETVNEARGEPVWYQLYATNNWDVAERIVRRVERAGCPALVFTVDLPVTTNRETVERWSRIDPRDCASCHVEGGMAPPVKPMYEGTNMAEDDWGSSNLTWDFLARLRETTDLKLLVKGIVTREDAELCVRYGCDGVWVSNHGGRASDSGRATIDSLPEVVEAVRGRLPVIVDSGFRRGTDIFKALALGATAVAVGRPYLWGLGAFGQEGVERTLQILTEELKTTMGLMGTPTLADIGMASIGEP